MLPSRYHPDEKLSEQTRSEPEGLSTVYLSHFGGVEGLRQKGWTTATFAIILSICDRLRWRASLTGQGDNQSVVLPIRLPDGVEPRTALETHPQLIVAIETFFGDLKREFESLGIPLTDSEIWWSREVPGPNPKGPKEGLGFRVQYYMALVADSSYLG